jgi:hypothetical protein
MRKVQFHRKKNNVQLNNIYQVWPIFSKTIDFFISSPFFFISKQCVEVSAELLWAALLDFLKRKADIIHRIVIQ